MKLIFTRKSGDPEENDYFDVAILVEPIGKLRRYQELSLIGIHDGKVGYVSRKPVKGRTYSTYNAESGIRYQVAAIDWIRSQIGKPYGGVRFWQEWSFFNDPKDVQSSREERGVWTAAEFAFVAMWKAEVRLFNNVNPYQMTPEKLTDSTRINFRSKISAE